MFDVEKLREELDLFGVEIPEDDSLINEKVEEICSAFKLDESEFSSEWMAFSTSRSAENGKKFTYENLTHLEQNLLREKQKDEKSRGHSSDYGQKMEVDDDDFGIDFPLPTQKKVTSAEILQLYGTPEIVQLASDTADLNARSSTLPAPETFTPKSTGASRNAQKNILLNTPGLRHMSPQTFSPVDSKLSVKYEERQNSLEVVCSYGDCESVNWTSQEIGRELEVKAVDPGNALNKAFKYMMQKMPDVIEALDNQIDDFAKKVSENFQIEEFANVREPNQGEVYVCGQVFCDGNGKLNGSSVMLQGSYETSMGCSVAVDTSQLPEFTFFPGQVTVLEGSNPSGRKFIAEKQITGFVPSQHDVPGVTHKLGKLSVMVGCGPFTTTDSVAYQPLYDFLMQVAETKPDLVILIGPFVDEKHPQVNNCSLERSFMDIFERLVVRISELTQECGVQIIFVPCAQRDVHQDPIYPNPPFRLKRAAKRIHQRMTFFSDPCMVSVGGVVIGLSGTDILFHLGAEEISLNRNPEGSDRMRRLLRHLMEQQCFYPLFPSSEELNVEYEMLRKYCTFDKLPHVLITPSDLRYFVKDVEGVCCVNPGRLARGQGGGTFARMVMDLQNVENKTVSEKMAVEILRI